MLVQIDLGGINRPVSSILHPVVNCYLPFTNPCYCPIASSRFSIGGLDAINKTPCLLSYMSNTLRQHLPGCKVEPPFPKTISMRRSWAPWKHLPEIASIPASFGLRRPS